MINLLKAEYYKLLHKQSFWGLLLLSLALGSLLLTDSKNTTSDLLKGSLYNLPQIYFITIIFAALFIGEDFENRTLQSFVSAGHKRGTVFFAKTLSYLTASCALLAVPVLFHSAAAAIMGNIILLPFSDLLSLFMAILAMGMLPLLPAFLFRDIGKTFALPMVLYFLMIFALNSRSAAQMAMLLPIGQIRLISLNQLTAPTAVTACIDGLWILLSGLLAYGSFCRCDLK